MTPVQELRRRALLTQAELARAAGTSQPAIAAYETGTKSPTLRTLDRLASSVGHEVAVTFVPVATREDRRSLALGRAIAAELLAHPDEVVARARRNLRRMQSQNPGAEPLLGQWERILERPTPAIAEVLGDPGSYARDLRQVTPFAGVLDAGQRTAVYRAFQAQEASRLACEPNGEPSEL